MTVLRTIGRKVAEMSDKDILDILNANIEPRQAMAGGMAHTGNWTERCRLSTPS